MIAEKPEQQEDFVRRASGGGMGATWTFNRTAERYLDEMGRAALARPFFVTARINFEHGRVSTPTPLFVPSSARNSHCG